MATKKKPTRKATKTAKPTKAAIPATAAKASGTKGKRYTPAEKAKVVSFVNSVNAEKGRGGVTAAVKKFGVTALTISTWLKKAGGAVKVTKTAAAPIKNIGGRGPGKSADVLDQLVTLRDEIRALESTLAAKRVQFDKLKGKL